ALLKRNCEAETSRLQALAEVAGIVREFGGEEDVGLGEAAVGDANYGDAGARRRFGEEPSCGGDVLLEFLLLVEGLGRLGAREVEGDDKIEEDRKSTRLNSSHLVISYAV